MNWKALSILGVLCFAILIYLEFGVIRVAEKKEEQEKQEALVFKNLERLDSIQLLNTKSPEILLRQTNSRWNVEKPFQDIVSKSQLEAFVASLRSLQIKSVLLEAEEFKARAQNLDQYGLRDSSFRVKLETGGTVQELILGDMVGDSFEIYAKRGREEKILLVGSDLESARHQSAEDWREKRLVNVDASQLIRLSIKNKNEQIEFERESPEKPWKMTKPLALPLDQEFTNNRISKISLVQAIDFLGSDPAALQNPDIRVKALFADGVSDARSRLNDPLPQGVELFLARKKRQGVNEKDAGDEFEYFGRSDKSLPATIARFHFENFDRSAKDFVDKQFDDFLSTDVEEIRVFRAGKLDIVAQKRGSFEQPEIELTQGEKIEKLGDFGWEKALQHLRNLVASDFIAPEKKPALSKTLIAIELSFKDKSTRYFYFENSDKSARMWTNKSGLELAYQLREKALDSSLFTAEGFRKIKEESSQVQLKKDKK